MMKSHNGMRPQDVVLLLKILIISEKEWNYRYLASQLFMSISEISESLNRSHVAGLVDISKKKIHRQSLMEFVQYGLRYVFPQVPGTMVTGVTTAHSHPFYRELFAGETVYVWPFDNGDERGLAIQPLYKTAPEAAQHDALFYKLLAGIDILRVGRAREVTVALDELKKVIL
jgi:predicted transcriptional regulator